MEEQLDLRTHRWRIALASAVCLVLLAYVFWFALVVELPVSRDPATWGQFGDYFGGVLNPLVAFAAFVWLAQSVRIQGNELVETRRALRDAAQAQGQQAQLAQDALIVNALTASLNAATSISSEKQRIFDHYLRQCGERASQMYVDEFGRNLRRDQFDYSMAQSRAELDRSQQVVIEYLNELAETCRCRKSGASANVQGGRDAVN